MNSLLNSYFKTKLNRLFPLLSCDVILSFLLLNHFALTQWIMDPYTAAYQAELSQSSNPADTPAKDPAHDEATLVKTFTCGICNFTSPYTYYGRKPPSTKSRMILLEDAYVIKNPFVDPRQSEKATVSGKPVHPPLILGSHCSVCRSPVCVAVECSYFYTKRFCKECMEEYLEHFPEQVRKEFQKNVAVPPS